MPVEIDHDAGDVVRGVLIQRFPHQGVRRHLRACEIIKMVKVACDINRLRGLLKVVVVAVKVVG